MHLLKNSHFEHRSIINVPSYPALSLSSSLTDAHRSYTYHIC